MFLKTFSWIINLDYKSSAKIRKRNDIKQNISDLGAFQIVARFQKIYLPLCKSNNKK